MRYGENLHQTAAFYRTGTQKTGWALSELKQGKQLSYNNMLDLEKTRVVLEEFSEEEKHICVLVKHNNPWYKISLSADSSSAVATADSQDLAYKIAFEQDPINAYGATVGFNKPITVSTAKLLAKTFLECTLAPGCSDEAAQVLTLRPKMRLVILQNMSCKIPMKMNNIGGGMVFYTKIIEKVFFYKPMIAEQTVNRISKLSQN